MGARARLRRVIGARVDVLRGGQGGGERERGGERARRVLKGWEVWGWKGGDGWEAGWPERSVK